MEIMCRKKGGNGPGRFHTIVAENVLLQVTFYEIHAIISSKDQNLVTWFLTVYRTLTYSYLLTWRREQTRRIGRTFFG